MGLLLRPFDIGDRVVISQPGMQPPLIENHLLRNMSVTNLSRSGELTLTVQVQVPSATPSQKVTELADAIRMYCNEREADWIGVDLLFSSTDFSSGHLNLDILALSRHLHRQSHPADGELFLLPA